MPTNVFIKIAVKSGTTTDESAEKSLAAVDTWETVSEEWATNPDTSAAWTWSEIDALQTGLALKKVSGLSSARCTQVYVVVDYTPGASIPVVMYHRKMMGIS